MSYLETLVKPLLEPMVHDVDRVELAHVDQARLARWAVKTSLLLGYAVMPQRPAEREDLDWIRDHEAPRRLGEYALLAATSAEPPTARCTIATSHAMRPGSTIVEATSRVVTIQIRHLVMQTVRLRREDGGVDEVRLTGEQIEQTVPLWPSVQELCVWPPARRLSLEALPAFTENFTQPRGFLRWLSPRTVGNESSEGSLSP